MYPRRCRPARRTAIAVRRAGCTQPHDDRGRKDRGGTPGWPATAGSAAWREAASGGGVEVGDLKAPGFCTSHSGGGCFCSLRRARCILVPTDRWTGGGRRHERPQGRCPTSGGALRRSRAAADALTHRGRPDPARRKWAQCGSLCAGCRPHASGSAPRQCGGSRSDDSIAGRMSCVPAPPSRRRVMEAQLIRERPLRPREPEVIPFRGRGVPA
jgi:hypothetical protein